MTDALQPISISPDLLRSFVAAADAGSVTGAARLVNRTQSAVSMQIKKLEEDLGRTVFERRPRGVALTADGETLYRYARRILRLYDEATSSLRVPEQEGGVRLGVPEDFAAHHLPGILKRFSVQCPRIRVDVLCDASPLLQERLGAGDLNLCLCTGEAAVPGGIDMGLMPLRWLGPELGLPAPGEPLPLAVFHVGCPYRQGALLALEQAGVAYRIAYSSPGVAGVLAAVQAGLAVAPLGRGVAAPGCRTYGPLDGLPELPAVPVSLYRGTEDSPLVDVLVQFVRDALGEESWDASGGR